MNISFSFVSHWFACLVRTHARVQLRVSLALLHWLSEGAHTVWLCAGKHSAWFCMKTWRWATFLYCLPHPFPVLWDWESCSVWWWYFWLLSFRVRGQTVARVHMEPMVFNLCTQVMGKLTEAVGGASFDGVSSSKLHLQTTEPCLRAWRFTPIYPTYWSTWIARPIRSVSNCARTEIKIWVFSNTMNAVIQCLSTGKWGTRVLMSPFSFLFH